MSIKGMMIMSTLKMVLWLEKIVLAEKCCNSSLNCLKLNHLSDIDLCQFKTTLTSELNNQVNLSFIFPSNGSHEDSMKDVLIYSLCLNHSLTNSLESNTDVNQHNPVFHW